MEVFDINKFNVNKHYAIEASAGTGKTYSIKKIVRKLLETTKLDLSQILIVTFTEKATGELKHRIREELQEAKLTGYDLDNMPIFTIHSFCNSVIQEFNLSIKKPFELNNIDEGEVESFINAYIRDNSNIQNFLAQFDEDIVSGVIEKLSKSVERYYLNDKFKEDKSIIHLFDKYYSTSKEFKELHPEVIEAIEYIENNRGSVTKKKELETMDKVITSINESISNIDYEHGFSHYSYFTQNSVFLRTIDGERYFEPLNLAKKESESFGKGKARICANICAKYLPEIMKEWLKYKEKNKLQTFNDMIRVVREEISKEGSKLLEKIQGKYKVGIIDEFQDTNQLQWDIFRKIFMNDTHQIIVVGDPKQSIYSFQGADVSVYKSAVEEIEKSSNGTKEMLQTNYRSSSDMIEACNRIFSVDNFFYDKGLIFNSSKSPSTNHTVGKIDGKTFKPVWIVNDVKEEEFSDIAVRKIIECTSLDESKKTRLQLTKAIKEKDEEGNEVEKIVTRDVTFSDFAILYRTRSESNIIEQRLKYYGVPYVKYKDNGLFRSTECAHWISILEAIFKDDLTGKNIKYFKRALFTKFFNKSLYEINADEYNLDSSKEMQTINGWKEKARERLWEDLIDDILIDSEMVDRMADSTKLDAFVKYRQIGNALIDYLSNNHKLLEAINYLKSKSKDIDSDAEEENDDIVEKGTDFPAVKLMTIHASKGLEFPVVISSTGYKGPRSSQLYIYKKDYEKIMAYHSTDEYKEQQCQEWMRLFYVDFTRASYLLMMPIVTGKEYKEENIPSGDQYLNKKLREFTANEDNEAYFDLLVKDNTKSDADYKKDVKTILANIKKSNTNDDKSDNELLGKTIDNIKNTSTYKHSYSSLSHPDEKKEKSEDDKLDHGNGEDTQESLEKYDLQSKPISLDYDINQQIIIPDKFPKGATIGTTLHEVFEKYDFTDTNDDTLKDLIIERFRENGIKEDTDWINTSIGIVRNVLGATFTEIKGSDKTNNTFKLSDVELKDKLAEVEFNFKIDVDFKNYFNGFVDLVFRRGNLYSIIDWKSDSLNDTDFESYSDFGSLKAHVDKMYSIQRVLYAHILIDWLSERTNKSKSYVFENNFGGVYYVFMKGCVKDTHNGIYAHTWNSYDELDNAYKNILNLIGGKKNGM